MTIEIQELIIQARVTDGGSAAMSPLPLVAASPMEQDKIVAEIVRQVLEKLRDEREERR